MTLKIACSRFLKVQTSPYLYSSVRLFEEPFSRTTKLKRAVEVPESATSLRHTPETTDVQLPLTEGGVTRRGEGSNGPHLQAHCECRTTTAFTRFLSH